MNISVYDLIYVYLTMLCKQYSTSGEIYQIFLVAFLLTNLKPAGFCHSKLLMHKTLMNDTQLIENV